MRKFLFPLTALLFASLTMLAQNKEKASFGLKTGLNISDLRVKGPLSGNISPRLRTGFVFGSFVNIPLSNKVSLQPEFLYSSMGGNYNDGISDTKYRFNYFSIPILLKYKILNNLAIVAGPQLDNTIVAKKSNTNISGVQKITTDLKENDFAITGGIQYWPGKYVVMGARYIYGFYDVNKNLAPGLEYYNRGVQLTIGFRFHKTPKPVPPPVVEPPKDTDGDGITDDLDKCPTVKGIAKYNGCPVPDTDKDGINDEEDKCPNVPGLARYQGCPIPDTDKDGINDEEDKCPTVPGLARYQGCPIPDTDKDGVNDEEDKCPDLAGTVANNGCPEIAEEVKKKVNFAAKNILFATGSYKLLSSSNKGLNEVVKIMQDNEDLKLAIDGYTDNTGKADKNQTLSENRADAVKAFLISKGISESRLTAAGHGQNNPVSDNKTASGRAKNRRVELNLSYY